MHGFLTFSVRYNLKVACGLGDASFVAPQPVKCVSEICSKSVNVKATETAAFPF